MKIYKHNLVGGGGGDLLTVFKQRHQYKHVKSYMALHSQCLKTGFCCFCLTEALILNNVFHSKPAVSTFISMIHSGFSFVKFYILLGQQSDEFSSMASESYRVQRCRSCPILRKKAWRESLA